MRGLMLGMMALALLALGGCDDQGAGGQQQNPRAPQPEMMMSADVAAAGAGLTRAAPQANAPRMEIVRSYGIEVSDGQVKSAMEADRAACLELGCNVTAVRTSANARNPFAHLEALIPRDKADIFHAHLMGEAGRVVETYVETAANREQQYQDIEARLKRLEFMRKRLYALADQKSDEIGDLLQVERELMRVETEIERMTRVRMGLEKVTDNVRVTLDYRARPPKAGDVDFGPFTGLLADMANALITGVRATALWVARWLPVIVIGIGAFALIRRWRRSKKPGKPEA